MSRRYQRPPRSAPVPTFLTSSLQQVHRWERRLAPLGPFEGANRRKGAGRLVVTSNRLPVVLDRDGENGWRTRPADGGLVTALDPVLRRRGGMWIGWSGALDVGQEELSAACGTTEPPYELLALELDEEERDRFYHGFSNEVIWPVFHGFPQHCNPEPAYWEAYRGVNERFARALLQARLWDDLVWVHDYHLLLVGEALRALGVQSRLAFFLHIPFPPPEALAAIPWHRAIVRALLHYDLVGFQMVRDRNNFLAAVQEFFPDGLVAEPGRGQVFTPAEVRSGAFPISIDFDEFAEGSARPAVAERAAQIRRQHEDRTLILGVDRLDYTKGVPEKLRGFRVALERYPELEGRVVMKQLVVPSRERIPAYAETRRVIEALVREINDEWGRADWTPVEYEYGQWTRSELLAHYRAAEIALVTPLIDGMNLVAKEYCVANGGSGVVILSAFAGAAAELGGAALLIDPSAPEAVAGAIDTARTMPENERRKRMTEAREAMRVNHVYRWVDAFLEEGVRAGP